MFQKLKEESNDIVKMNLQLLASNGDEGDEGGQEDSDDDGQEDPKPKTFTQEEVNEMIKARLAKEAKKQKKAQDEADKLKNLSAEQKKAQDEAKQTEEVSTLLAELKRERMLNTITKELSDRGMSTKYAEFCMADTAEDVMDKINSLAEARKEDVDTGVKDRLKGNVPKSNTQAGESTMSKKEFLSKNYSERQKLFTENRELYNQIMGIKK